MVPKPSNEAELDPDAFRKSKRPMSPLFAFIKEKREEIAAMPGVTGLGQISKKGAELFKALTPEEREERQKRFEEEMKAYKEWQSTDEGKAVMNAKKNVMAKKRAAKKNKGQKNLGIGAFAIATTRKRKARAPSTPTKRPRILDKEEEAEKQRKNKELELRKQVLGATNPRDRAIALANQALAKGVIKPSWAQRTSKSKAEQPAGNGTNAAAQALSA